VHDHGDHKYLEVVEDSEGDYTAESTAGFVYETERIICEDCGDFSSTDEDDFSYSDYHELRLCPHCVQNYNYVVAGAYYDRDYISQDIPVHEYGDMLYTEDALTENDLVLTQDGVISIDDAVWSEYDQEWYHCNDVQSYETPDGDQDYVLSGNSEVIKTEDSELFMLKEDCYENEGLWYEDQENIPSISTEEEDEVIQKTA